MKTNNNIECEYLIVLGGGIKGSNPSLALKYRLDTAAEYMLNHPNCTAILSGGLGSGQDFTEAYVMHKYMLNKGIASERLITEEKSSDTTENIKYSKEIIDAYNNTTTSRVMVVTSDFHIYRSMLIMKKSGFTEYYALPAPTPNLPFFRFNCHLREYFSILLEYVNL